MNNFHRLLRYYCYRCLYEYNNNIDEEEGFLLLPAFLENLLVEGSTRSTRTRPTTKFPYRSFPQPDTNVARIYGRGVFIILSAFPLPPSPPFSRQPLKVSITPFIPLLLLLNWPLPPPSLPHRAVVALPRATSFFSQTLLEEREEKYRSKGNYKLWNDYFWNFTGGDNGQ